MKRLLLFILFLFCALSIYAQQKQSSPIGQSPAVVYQPPHIVVRMPKVISMTWGRIHFGGFEQNVVFLQPPEVRIVPARIIYILPNAVDTLSGHLLLLNGRADGFYLKSGKKLFLPDVEPLRALPQPKANGIWQNNFDALFNPQYGLQTDSNAVQ